MSKVLKFTTGEQNLAKKFNLDLTKKDEPVAYEAENPFSGVTVQLNPLGAQLYQLTLQKYRDIERGLSKNVAEYDRLKYLFLKLFPDAYMDLID